MELSRTFSTASKMIAYLNPSIRNWQKLVENGLMVCRDPFSSAICKKEVFISWSEKKAIGIMNAEKSPSFWKSSLGVLFQQLEVDKEALHTFE